MHGAEIARFLDGLVDRPLPSDAPGAISTALLLLARELPSGIVATVGLAPEVPSIAVAVPPGERLPALPLDGLIRRVIEAGQSVRIREGSRDLYLADSPDLAARLEGAGCTDTLLVPLRDAGHVVGALVAAAGGRLESAELELLDEAADALSLVLRSLETEQPAEFERRLTQVRRVQAQALEGLPLDGVLAALARVLDAEVEFVEGGVVEAAPLALASRAPSDTVVVAAGGRTLGRMLVRVRGRRLPRALLDEAAAAIRKALLIQRLLRDEDTRPRRNLADELVGTLGEAWTMRGSRADYDLEVPLTALLATRDEVAGARRATDEELVALVGRALGARASRTLVALRPGEVLALLPRQVEEDVIALAEGVVASAHELGSPRSVSCFVSATGYSRDRIYAQVGQLVRLRRLAFVLGRRGAVMAASHAGIDGLLLQTGNPEQLAGWRDRLLRPLLEHDRARNASLLVTLESFLSHWCHLQRCADALHIHLNTLKYRLHRIEDVLEIDLRDPTVRAELLVACHAHRVLLALEESTRGSARAQRARRSLASEVRSDDVERAGDGGRDADVRALTA